jgi:hypothetical protein
MSKAFALAGIVLCLASLVLYLVFKNHRKPAVTPTNQNKALDPRFAPPAAPIYSRPAQITDDDK